MHDQKMKPGLLKRARDAIAQSLLFNIIIGIFESVCKWLFHRTLGVTSKFLSRPPAAPDVTVVDRRCNRVRLKFHPVQTSIFNVDVYEAQHALAGSDSWSSDPDTDQEGRVIAPLKQDTEYDFRVRAKNCKGLSPWSTPVRARTLLVPVDGGATLPAYTWSQSGVEVSIAFPIPGAVRAADVLVELRPQHLRVAFRQGGEEVVLADGTLPQRVRSLAPGGTSYWEIDRDGKASKVNVVLEKERPARNIKFDFWRSAFDGHPEIDTHRIDSDPHVKPAQLGGGLNMQQMQANVLDGGAAGIKLKSKGDDFDLSSLPINMQKLYKQ